MAMYLDYYGLKELPFNITPDPRFLFYSVQHREAFDHLLYGIEQRKGFIELTGEVGSGKTTLCRAVLSNLSSKVKTALVLNPSVSGTQLLRAILNDFGIPVKKGDRLSYIEQLNSFLLEQTREGNNVAVMIDEAQDLAPSVMEQVRLLSNLETDQHKLMQIVLAGQPELRERLARPELRQLRQRIMVRCNLRPLTEEETGQYISHRLRVAGANGSVGFEPVAVRRVHEHAKGTPRVVNAVCDRAMIAGYVAQKKRVGVSEVDRALKDMESMG
jgi:general secretion pathway protein A